MIIARYELPPPDGIAIAEIDDWRERKLRPIQNRVLMCLTAWLEDHNMLNEDPHIAQPMSEFLSLIAQPPPLALAARLILNTLKRLV
jgi:son of sevenless-like protein